MMRIEVTIYIWIKVDNNFIKNTQMPFCKKMKRNNLNVRGFDNSSVQSKLTFTDTKLSSKLYTN